MAESREPDPTNTPPTTDRTDTPPTAEGKAARPDRGGKTKKGKKARAGADTAAPPAPVDTARPVDVRRAAVASGHVLVGRTAWCGRAWGEGIDEGEPSWRRAAAPGPSGLAGGPPPPRPTLNRSVPPDVVYTDTPVVVNGKTVVILRRERGFPAGPLPGDPGRLVVPIAGGSAICHVLAPAAALRCRAG